MTSIEARNQLQRTVAHTLGRKLILAQATAAALLTDASFAGTAAGKGLQKECGRHQGERFTLPKEAAVEILEAMPAVPGSLVEQPAENAAPTGKTSGKGGSKGGKGTKDKPADKPADAAPETLEQTDAAAAEGKPDVL